MPSNNNTNELYLKDLINKSELLDDDLFIVEDNENTKNVRFIDLIISLIKDKELPSSHRLYSSEKIYDIFEEYKNDIDKATSGFDNRINELEKNKATIKLVKSLFDELNANKIGPRALDPINQALENKRNSNVLLTSSDLDTSSDDVKLHVKNLGMDILETIAGGDPLKIAAAPEGGWGSNYISDKAIISTKLGPYYRYKGYITEGHIDEIIADGIYIIGVNVKGVPVHGDDIGTELKMLEVTRFGEAGNYIEQRINYIANSSTRPIYYRKGQLTRIHSIEFESLYYISDKFKLTSDLMGDSYTNKGIISSGNLFDTRIEGSYKVLPGVINTPDINKEFLVKITHMGDKYIYTAYGISISECIIYEAMLYYDSINILTSTQWFRINAGNKSKFDGKRLLIFGDGISFGVGASTISKTSYASLLYEKYGFRITNYSVGNATVGNYANDLLKEKSILTQIDNATIDNTSEYALIFAGTNDYSNIKSDLGDINDYKDTTFYGSLNMAISKILMTNPSTKLVLVTPLYRTCINIGDNKNCDDYQVNYKWLYQFSNAILEVAKKHRIPVLDLFNYGTINKYNADYYLSNGLYPNDKGHELLSDKIFDIFNSNY